MWDWKTGDFLIDDRFKDRVNDDGELEEKNGVRSNIVVIAPMGVDRDASLTPYCAAWETFEKLGKGILRRGNVRVIRR